jgi:hypothetical protein
VKHAGEVVEILEAFDLTGSLRAASELAGCSPNTVARYVRRGSGWQGPSPILRAVDRLRTSSSAVVGT